jgi:type II secretory pathway predicted ATPase ExeA
MYLSHFGLRSRPFRPGPDPASYYPATTQERALACLLQAVGGDEGFALLTGEPGLGKTLLCHCLIERLRPRADTVFLTGSRFPDRVGLLQSVLFDQSLPYEGKSEQELRLALTDHLLARHVDGQGTLLVLDEAQHLTADLLEELRLLVNLEAGRGKAVRVLLAATPELVDLLGQPALTSVCQRLAVRARLEPLGVDEASDYLLHQVRVAGGQPERVYTDEALEILSKRCRGIPRRLNQAAHQALALAHGIGSSAVDAEAALEALALLGLEGEATAATDDRFPALHAAGDAESAEGAGAAASTKPSRTRRRPPPPARSSRRPA